MSEPIRISDEFYRYLVDRNRDGETMEEPLRRLVGGPRPAAVAGILSSETAAAMREQVAGNADSETDE